MMRKYTIIFIIIGFYGMSHVHSQNRTLTNQTNPQKEVLLKLAEAFQQKYLIQRAEVERVAKERGWVIRQETPEGVSEIMYIDSKGFPQAYGTTNLNAARSTNTDDIWVGGSTGLNLNGSGYLVGEWDGGGVLTTHQEFNNGTGTRVTQMDVPAATSYHSTHVAGTMIAEGQVASAHGMATEALLHAYEWTNDNAEMATEAAGGLTLSNHSYGLNRGWNSSGGNMYWWGNPGISATEDYLFGFYDSNSQAWDQIAFNAPNYLIVKASGNDRNDAFSGSHYVYNGTNWVASNAVREQDGGSDGYDCIEQGGVAKNILTIGAVNDIAGGWTAATDVVQSTFSSWGPTDDGRIKPDLVANGVGVYSTTDAGNTLYTTLDGTSMATPNTTGTLVLLQDYYKSLKGGTMSAAAIKGLVINTANEAGPSNGPDYQNGWGLLNATGAAGLIAADNTQGGLIVQAVLVNGQTTDYTYYSDGLTPINVTLCWTDPAGTPPAASLNPGTLMLVNDLDVRVIGTSTNMPWILNPASPSVAATKGDNFRDNVESVNMLSPVAGYYTIRINHSGTLSGGLQAYALIVNGMRTIPADTYCNARSTYWSSLEYISHVAMGTISNTSGRSPGGFGDFTGMVNKIIQGTSETLSVTINGYSGDQGKAWVDWNQDGDFADAGEEFALGTGAGPAYSVSIAAPPTALTGYTTMRVRLSYGAHTSCGNTSYGETEDYTINVLSHCEAEGGCFEHISNVLIGSINNTSGCGKYSDYTSLSASLPLNSPASLIVTNGSPYSGDQCGVWVDWNDDGDFSDANETIAVAVTPGLGPYTATIDPPLSTTLGTKVMRVRITYTGVVDPCGITSYGEVEDYTINVTAALPNYWVGGFNHYWHHAANWSLGHIPTIDEPVYVNNVGYQPVYVDNYAPFLKEECSSLSIGAGAQLEVQTMELSISNDLTINGQLGLTDPAGVIRALGNVAWNSGSTANFTANGIFWVYGDWNFNPGATANLASGSVFFAGAGINWIRSYSAACALPNVMSYKSGTDWLRVSNLSTQPLTVNGTLFTDFSCNLSSYSSQDIILKGNLAMFGNFDFTGLSNTGTLVFDGTTQSAGNYGTGTGVINNIRFSSSGTTTAATNLTVAGNLTIDQGTFSPGATTLTVAGNWTNTVGTSGFAEGTSRVIFNGASHNYVSSETFNIIEANMGAALRVNNAANTVICNQYDWTTGGIDVIAGTFTALDLVDSGLFGTFWVNPGGSLNITQDAGQFTDLHGELHIYGGTMTVTGGAGASYWPYMDNALIEMSNGILDFKNNGIYIYNTAATLTESITGGIIRTDGRLAGTRTDFNPAGGTFEMYGTAEAFISQGLGSTFANLVINKPAVLDISQAGSEEVFYNREGDLTDIVASSVVTSSSNLVLTGDLVIQAGTLIAPASIKVGRNWNNLVGTSGFTEGTGTVEFDGPLAADVLSSETFYNLSLNKTYASFDALEVWNSVSVTNDLHLIDGTMKFRSPANLTVSGNLTIDLNAGLNVADSYGPQVSVGKNWTNANTGYASNFGFYPGNNSTVIFNGNLDQMLTTSATAEEFRNLTINKTAGKFRPSDNITCTADILISNGIWEDFVSGLSHAVYSDFTVASTGAFHTSAVANTVEFVGSEHSNLTYSGVTGYFRNILVNKGIGYSVNQIGYATCQNSGNFTVNQGYYFLNGNSLLVTGNINVNNAGYLSLSPASSLILTDTRTLSINSGGRLELNGTAANQVTVRANVPTAYYDFNVLSGGTIAADYALIKNTSANGLFLQLGSSVDPAHAFKSCTFQDGITGFAAMMVVNNSQVFVVRNANFPTNTWGGTFNVYKAVGAGHVYFVDYTGAYAGTAFEYDPYNIVDWVPTLLSTPTATPGTICAGSTSQLNAVPAGCVAPYSYAWSPAAGLSNTSIIDPLASPLTTTNYSVTVTDALGTTKVSSVLLTVNPLLPVSVTVSASANPSPPGDIVNFTATPVNGGPFPTYQWKVNGSNVGTGPAYNYIPDDNDHVTCEMTSNYPCITGNPATSNTITMIMVPVNQTVTGGMTGPLSLCFDATNTITVAGGGSTFIVRTGASAVMIAGERISYLPGATVEAGGYLHGYITTTNGYCGIILPTMPAMVAGQDEAIPAEALPASLTFSLYPNPTTGVFTLLNKGDMRSGNVRVEMFDLRGNMIYSTTYGGARDHKVTLPPLTPGLYFVKVISGNLIESFKLIVTR